MEYKSYGDYLKHLREDKGLNIAELGEKLEIKIHTIKRWERNLEVPTLDEMYKLSEFYQVPSERLIRLKDDLFKPNLKLVRAIATALGIPIYVAVWGFRIALVAGLIGACSYFMYAKSEIEKNPPKGISNLPEVLEDINAGKFVDTNKL